MKRDLDLVRKILIFFEEKENDRIVRELSFEGYSDLQVKYHLLLMDEAGLLRCERVVSKSTPTRVIAVHPFSLTWDGHEFLEASKDDSFWNKAKSKVTTSTGALSFDVLKALLIAMAKESVGL
ncbi:DUF2513 domain-containing protein [Kineobactrum salinum]|uniref:DUF2513 domain-containing protein n=1 Tax=Kineobactrum salinum TaxID=2708301 RepID=A0A6C0U3S6_9GAMM|nr:DUF2513 domain-containing protein [Kineobactrum salinum]QIB65005.1 DUF2513 domain-containing protein [Kineobactrum salinum]